jgi:hypothetical protein
MFLSVLLITGVLSSCQEDEKSPRVSDPIKEEKVAQVIGFREDLNFINRFVSDNVIDLSNEEGRKSSASRALARLAEVAPCAEATEEELPNGSLKITMDFGDGCVTEEGIEVAGSVVMIFTNSEYQFEYSLEFTDYQEISLTGHAGEVVNGQVFGNFILDLENGEFTQELEQDLTITYPDNTEAVYHAVQKAEMTETGMRVVQLETSGNFADGGAFLTTLSKALVYDFSCEGDFPVKGEEVVTFQGNTIKVNYGSGSCDETYSAR